MNDIAWSYRAIDSQVRVLDLGRSFEKLCRKADGVFVEFGKRRPSASTRSARSTDIEADMAILSSGVAKMASLAQPLEEFAYKAIAIAILSHGKRTARR